jgi:prepilin-type N-terminal cleavage/methylation domain-containing protein
MLPAQEAAAMWRNSGFTLVELMIVVAIVGVLAVVAGTAYRRYMDAGRVAEVNAMIGEFRVKEEAYKAEAGVYLATTTVGETDYWPVLQASGEPKLKFYTPAPASWTTLGLQPPRQQMYCGYVVVAGPGGAWPATAGTLGKALWNNAAPALPFFYVNASCDNDGNPAVNSTFTAGSVSTVVVSKNEHK